MRRSRKNHRWQHYDSEDEQRQTDQAIDQVARDFAHVTGYSFDETRDAIVQAINAYAHDESPLTRIGILSHLPWYRRWYVVALAWVDRRLGARRDRDHW